MSPALSNSSILVVCTVVCGRDVTADASVTLWSACAKAWLDSTTSSRSSTLSRITRLSVRVVRRATGVGMEAVRETSSDAAVVIQIRRCQVSDTGVCSQT